MPDRIFYDGDCGLCHWAVSFVVPRDRDQTFRFAPLDSQTFRTLISEAERARLPDSMVVLTRDGRQLTRSAAVLHIMSTIGGVWRPVAGVARLVPAAVRDWAYDRVAAVRRRVFAKPSGVCPVLPPDLRARFDV